MEITLTPKQIISAYGGQLQHGDLDNNVRTHLLGVKFVKGNTEVSDSVPLAAALIEEFESDVHFTLYSTPTCVRCVKADVEKYDFTFSFAAVDLDFGDHSEAPKRDDFAHLIMCLYVVDRLPSVLYETKRGARAIYLIRPMHNAEVFELHYRALLIKLNKLLQRSSTQYRVDTATGDWTRLFRAPRVVRDGQAEYDRLVCRFHNKVIDFTKFTAPKRKPRVQAVGNLPYDAGDLYLLRLTHQEMTEGNRNNSTFKALCHAHRTYSGEALDRWIDRICDAAIQAGLDDREFEAIHRSAQQTYNQQRDTQ